MGMAPAARQRYLEALLCGRLVKPRPRRNGQQLLALTLAPGRLLAHGNDGPSYPNKLGPFLSRCHEEIKMAPARGSKRAEVDALSAANVVLQVL